MKVKNGKILKATESELFAFYLKQGYDDVMDFYEFKRRCIRLGTKVIEKGGVEE